MIRKLLYVVCRTELGDKKIITVTKSWEFARKLAESFGYVVEIHEDVAEKFEGYTFGGVMPKKDSLQLDPFEPVGGKNDAEPL